MAFSPPSASALNRRVALVCALCLIAALYLHSLGESRAMPLSRPLPEFPKTVANWQGGPDQALPPEVVNILGVDSYLSRDYLQEGGGRVNFYASFFSSTRGGKSYHSPRNCMPGGGWDVVASEEIALDTAHADATTVTRMVLQKGSDRLVALYWFQGRGRVMANEYSERIYRVLDSLVSKRTDGAFIRILADVPAGNIAAARQWATDFGRAAILELNRFLPPP